MFAPGHTLRFSRQPGANACQNHLAIPWVWHQLSTQPLP